MTAWERLRVLGDRPDLASSAGLLVLGMQIARDPTNLLRMGGDYDFARGIPPERMVDFVLVFGALQLALTIADWSSRSVAVAWARFVVNLTVAVHWFAWSIGVWGCDPHAYGPAGFTMGGAACLLACLQACRGKRE